MDFVRAWKGEIWGANSVYKEVIDGTLHRLDRLTGDTKAMEAAYEAKMKHNLSYELWSKNGRTDHIPGVKKINIHSQYTGDSGSSLVVMALEEGYDEVYLIGFDLGGQDIYVQGHEQKNKASWVRRWRQIMKSYGLHKIHFIGVDHKKFLLSDQPDDFYANMYTRGVPHLDYVKEFEFDEPEVEIPNTQDMKKQEKKVMILGNGVSRQDPKTQQEILNWPYEIWVCNSAFKEHASLPRINRVGSQHKEIAIQAYRYREIYGLKYSIYYKDFVPEGNGHIKVFPDKISYGWATGPAMVWMALKSNYTLVVLAGFDFGGPDVYQNGNLVGTNFIKQFKRIRRNYGKEFSQRVRFLNGTPAFLK